MVDKVLDTKTNEFVAIKTMKEKSHDSLPHFLLREISILKDLEGAPNILQLVSIYKESINSKIPRIKLVFKYYKDGDLSVFLNHKSPVPKEPLAFSVAIDFARQILTGLNAIHAK